MSRPFVAIDSAFFGPVLGINDECHHHLLASVYLLAFDNGPIP
jgi:hypothetical protein